MVQNTLGISRIMVICSFVVFFLWHLGLLGIVSDVLVGVGVGLLGVIGDVLGGISGGLLGVVGD